MDVSYTPTFVRMFKALPTGLQDEVIEKIEAFRVPANHPVLKVHKLSGRLKGRLSFSVNYQTRIVFYLEPIPVGISESESDVLPSDGAKIEEGYRVISRRDFHDVRAAKGRLRAGKTCWDRLLTQAKPQAACLLAVGDHDVCNR